MKRPVVHILLAAFNRGHLILETLESIKNQTYPRFKCFVTDDRSEDDTREIVEEFCRSDSRFEYHLKPDGYENGLSDTRNYGLDLASNDNAQFIQFFDDDDIMHPQKLDFQMLGFFKYPDVSVVICRYDTFIDANLTELKLHQFPKLYFEKNVRFKFLWRQLMINSLGPLFKADLIEDVRFDTSLIYGEEKALYLQLFFCKKPKFLWVAQSLFYYRKHSVSNTGGRYGDIEKMIAENLLNRKFFLDAEQNDYIDNDLIVFFMSYFLHSDYNPEILNTLMSLQPKDGIRSSRKLWLMRQWIRFQQAFKKLQVKTLMKI